MEQAVYAFRVEGKPVTCERYGFGHINKTYRIVTSWGNMYELQKNQPACIYQRIESDGEHWERDPVCGPAGAPSHGGAVPGPPPWTEGLV